MINAKISQQVLAMHCNPILSNHWVTVASKKIKAMEIKLLIRSHHLAYLGFLAWPKTFAEKIQH